jgi:RNA polymerase sigma-70 factor (ECF subfamily)
MAACADSLSMKLSAFGRPATAGTGSVRPGLEPDGFAGEALAQMDGLYSTALRLTRNGADAEDLVQDTYLKAFRASRRFERGTNLRAWLFTILHNTFLNRRRDGARNPVSADSETAERVAEAVASPHASPEDLVLRQASAAALREALDTLPEPFRDAVWLRDAEEFSYVEIAGMLDVPIGTVMSRISRGRRLLAQALGERSRDRDAR